EYTNRGAKALENFEKLTVFVRAEYPGKFLGIGTVKTAEDAKKFLPLKPDFLVSPMGNPQVALLCKEHDVPWMPGCLTPTEIFNASENGAAVIKIFPASAVEPSFVKAVKAVFPEIHVMPTGGIKPEKAVLTEWLDAGAICVGMGSELIEKRLLEAGNWSELRQKMKNAREVILSCKP
ncbi:MAG: bifunctional 4-hydroxy-2-oxoglutarate aldolase/2-dehydro-3-deoxy-phosphogluconate aldolase, partial [Chitinophagaceae bacterium]